MAKLIDLRSDTVTRPSEGMRRASNPFVGDAATGGGRQRFL
ncbi:MAG: hypothetical protein ACWGNS_06215 [Burkholderiales bacterium]